MSSPIIFEKGTRDFSTLGLGLLSDAIQATTTEELNGQFIFEMDYPISGNNADLIKENRIIVVNSGHILKRQGFIIRQIVRKIDLTMTVYAEHVSYATLDVALSPIGTISGDAKTALENWKRMLVPAVDFTVDSDILTTNSTSIGAPEFETARQGLGGHAGSILDVWGGEYQFDNWHIRLLKQRGKSANAIIAYGRNLISFEQDTNIADTYTSVYPYYQENSGDEGNKNHFLPERTVDSEFVGKYPNPKVLMLDLSNKFKDVADYSETKLRNYALSYIQSNNIGVPKVNMKISTVDLSRATGGFSEDIDLGDTVNVYFEKLGITTSSKVVKAVWNVLSDDYDKFEIGARRSSLTESISELATTADENANKALNQALVALQSADGKTTIYYLDSSDPWPTNPKENDTAFVKDGENSIMYRYMFNNDTGVFSWVKILDSMSADQIKQRVSDALESGKAYSDQLVAENASQINTVLDDVQAKQADLTAQQAELDTKAQEYANKALTDAKADTLATAVATAKTASDALATAKTDLTTSIAKEATDRTKAVSDLDTKAKGYADTAKADAISAGATADGVINKKIDDTASSIASTISQNKVDADGKITTAQSTATQALNGLTTKVSQTAYDTKTGQLTTDLNTTTTTANKAKTDIVSINQKDTAQDARMLTIEETADGIKTTVSNLQTEQGEQSGSISTLEQRADGFDATVATLGQVNQLFNTEFSPDLAGWYQGTSPSSGAYKVGNDLSADTSWSIDPSKRNGSAVLKHTYGSGLLSFFSNLIPVGEGVDITGSMWAMSTPEFTGSVSVAIYLRYYDANKNYIGVQSADSGKWTAWTQKYITRVTPTGTAYVSFNIQTNGGAGVTYYSQPMLTFNNKVGQYVQGNYNNNASVSKAQLTADNATLALSNYRSDADGRISKAQADIIVNAGAITQKVSQSDYNAKTGDLTTKVNTAQSTADSATSTIGAYKTSNDGRVASAESKITQNTNNINLRVTKTDYDANNNTINGKFSAITVTTDKITSSVSDVTTQVNAMGQINQLFNTEFTPDFNGWYVSTNTNPTTDVVTNQFTPNGTDGFGSNVVSHKGGGDWINSAPITVTPGMVLSFSTRVAVPKPVASGVPLALYIQAFDASNSRVLSTGYNIPVNQLTTAPTTFNLQNVVMPAGAVKAFAVFAWNVGDEVYISQPMLVFGSKVGQYTLGQYNNNDKIATQQITIDSITDVVSNPTTGLTKRVQTAEGTLSQVTGADIPNLQKATYWQAPNGYDLNTYLTQGSFFFRDTTARTNSPITSTKWMYLTVDRNAQGDRVTQTVWYDTQTDAKITYRRQYAGTWGAWYANDNDSVATIAQTNGAIQTEISNRATGDTNTLTQAKDFTTSSITSSESGMRSQITQTSDAILAKVDTKTDSSTVLSLLKDNWAIGITDNANAITNGIVGNATNMSLISNNVVINAPSTQIKGTAWINSAMIGTGQIGNAQIGDLAVTSAKISSLDVNKITGNITNFVKSGWQDAYGNNLSIDGQGMRVSYGDTSTFFGNGIVKFRQDATYSGGSNQVETIGGIATTHDGTVNHMVLALYDQTHIPFGSTTGKNIGSPANEIYGGDAISIGKARDFNGNFDSVFSYANNTAAGHYGQTPGFNFRDTVNFNSYEIISGSVNYNLKIGAIHFNGYFGDRFVPVIVASWSANTGGGIAFGEDAVMAFNQTSRKVLT